MRVLLDERNAATSSSKERNQFTVQASLALAPDWEDRHHAMVVLLEAKDEAAGAGPKRGRAAQVGSRPSRYWRLRRWISGTTTITLASAVPG